MDASLQPLLDAVSTPEFEDSGFLAITATAWVDDDVAIDLTLRHQDRDDEGWRLHCRAVRRSRISSHEHDVTDIALSITTTHPLLWPHTEPWVELYFSSRPSDPDAAVGRLMEMHDAVVGKWFDCFHFFNLGPDRSLRAMLDGGLGKLAEGPQSIIERYSESLRNSGVAVSSPPSRPPVWWNGEGWVKEEEPLYAVILPCSSFVISPWVTAQRT